jgi:hypothetical protein
MNTEVRWSQSKHGQIWQIHHIRRGMRVEYPPLEGGVHVRRYG